MEQFAIKSVSGEDEVFEEWWRVRSMSIPPEHRAAYRAFALELRGLIQNPQDQPARLVSTRVSREEIDQQRWEVIVGKINAMGESRTRDYIVICPK